MAMNLGHRLLCRSSLWKWFVHTRIVPWALDGLAFDGHVLEIGPGPGATTAVLRHRCARLTCVEIDSSYAASVCRRFADVSVIRGDATSMAFAAGTFHAAVCFTMLHHVPSAVLQDHLFSEVARVLRPGGLFAGSDRLASRTMKLLHAFDTYVPVDPAGLPDRLRRAGFADVEVDANPHAFRFRALRR